jgi:hypothetical protein
MVQSESNPSIFRDGDESASDRPCERAGVLEPAWRDDDGLTWGTEKGDC